jgi:hypothetical protein
MAQFRMSVTWLKNTAPPAFRREHRARPLCAAGRCLRNSVWTGRSDASWVVDWVPSPPTSALLARRIAACLDAVTAGTAVSLDNGHPIICDSASDLRAPTRLCRR